MASITLNGGGVKLDAGGYLQPLSYAEQWRLDYFGSFENVGLSADDANFDGDLSLNLFERAFHTDPTDGDDWFAARLIVVEEGGVPYPALEYRQVDGGSGTPGVDYSAGGMTYVVEAGIGALSWQSGAGFVQLHDSGTDNGDGSRTVRVRSLQPIDGEPLQFLRLKITETP